ncbi:barren inflorescence1 [Zea mays]|uniref:Auxin-responsive protein n=1 Tax=Zea mays TaxID=4577 RepID=A0A1D6FF65_MAIZE|nr:barren inflorescence1 [Zea mays]
MSVDTERSSTESSAASGLGYEDTALALTLRLPGSDPGRSSPLAAPSDAAPSPKTRVVGWPPVRSYRKNALADSSKANRSASFVKVAVDGAAYLRKVDLQAYGGYDQLLRALQDKFFSHFTISQCFVHRPALGLVFRSALLCLIERMFVETCRRLRLMKGSEAVNLGTTKSRPMRRKRNSSVTSTHWLLVAWLVGGTRERTSSLF